MGDDSRIWFCGLETLEKQNSGDFVSFVYSAYIALCLHICYLPIFPGMALGNDS
jgi:hypothetical protein